MSNILHAIDTYIQRGHTRVCFDSKYLWETQNDKNILKSISGQLSGEEVLLVWNLNNAGLGSLRHKQLVRDFISAKLPSLLCISQYHIRKYVWRWIIIIILWPIAVASESMNQPTSKNLRILGTFRTVMKPGAFSLSSGKLPPDNVRVRCSAISLGDTVLCSWLLLMLDLASQLTVSPIFISPFCRVWTKMMKGFLNVAFSTLLFRLGNLKKVAVRNNSNGVIYGFEYKLFICSLNV